MNLGSDFRPASPGALTRAARAVGFSPRRHGDSWVFADKRCRPITDTMDIYSAAAFLAVQVNRSEFCHRKEERLIRGLNKAIQEKAGG